jgi:hypothetical protein
VTRTIADIGAAILTGENARSFFDAQTEADAPHWNRDHLVRLDLPLFQDELDDMTEAGTLYVIERLERRIRTERRLGTLAHWSYDLNRHLGLLTGLKAEQRRLAQIRTENCPQILEAAK